MHQFCQERIIICIQRGRFCSDYWKWILYQKLAYEGWSEKDFNKEQEKFISENKKSDAVLAPWEGYQDEEQLKEQILALSKDKRNFLRAPPAGAQFEFDYTVSCCLFSPEFILEMFRNRNLSPLPC